MVIMARPMHVCVRARVAMHDVHPTRPHVPGRERSRPCSLCVGCYVVVSPRLCSVQQPSVTTRSAEALFLTVMHGSCGQPLCDVMWVGCSGDS